MTSNPTPTCAMCSSAWSMDILSIDSMSCCRGTGNPQSLSRPEATCETRTLTVGWSGDLHSRPHRQTCDNVGNSTKKSQTAHHGLRSDDLGTNRLSTGPLLGDGAAAARPGERRCSTVSSPFCTSVDVFSGFACLAGNYALDQPRARSSGVGAEVVRAACGPGSGVSDAMSLASKYASFGMSKFGALPFSTVARTASANCVSGRSHEP